MLQYYNNKGMQCTGRLEGEKVVGCALLRSEVQDRKKTQSYKKAGWRTRVWVCVEALCNIRKLDS